MGKIKHDVETIENNIIQIVKDNFATKVAEINTEKNDGVLITALTDGDYFSTFTEEVNNKSEFIYYGVDNISPDSTGPYSKLTIQFFILVFTLTMNETNIDENRKKSFRYGRCVQEIIQTASKKYGYLSQLKINQISPTDFALNEDSPVYKVGGVILTVDLA